MFSKTCEYAIRACIFIASETINGNRVSLPEVSKKIESPEAFTSKILQTLVKRKIIRSLKGPGGGFEIDKNIIENILLIDIVQSCDGNILQRCSLGLHQCSDIHPCPFHHKYKPIKESLIKVFSETSLKELIGGYQKGDTFLKF